MKALFDLNKLGIDLAPNQHVPSLQHLVFQSWVEVKLYSIPL